MSTRPPSRLEEWAHRVAMAVLAEASQKCTDGEWTDSVAAAQAVLEREVREFVLAASPGFAHRHIMERYFDEPATPPPQATGEGPTGLKPGQRCTAITKHDEYSESEGRGVFHLHHPTTEAWWQERSQDWRCPYVEPPAAKPPSTADMLPGQWCTKHGDEMHTTHEYNPSVAARWALQHNFGRCAYVEEPIAKCPGCGKTVSLFTEASDYTGPPRYWCSKLNCKLLPKPVPLEEIPSQDPSG